MSPTPCRVAGSIISIRPIYGLMRPRTYLLTYLHRITSVLSKSFDKMDHHALFIQLMRRNIPIILLKLLETWFDLGVTCVKWGSHFSDHVKLSCGIRQGGVLSSTVVLYSGFARFALLLHASNNGVSSLVKS